MDFRGFKIHIALLVMLFTFGALVGCAYLYRVQRQERPLLRALSSVAPVRELKVSYAGNRAEVWLRLGPVADLSRVYGDLERVLARTYGAGRYTFSVEGDPDATLAQFYDQAQYYLWQAIQQGDYADMAAAIAAEAKARGLTDERFSVTPDYVFLQAGDAAGHYLYVVAPRTRTEGGGVR